MRVVSFTVKAVLVFRPIFGFVLVRENHWLKIALLRVLFDISFLRILPITDLLSDSLVSLFHKRSLSVMVLIVNVFDATTYLR